MGGFPSGSTGTTIFQSATIPKGIIHCSVKQKFCDGFQIFFGLVLNHVARAYDDRKTTQ